MLRFVVYTAITIVVGGACFMVFQPASLATPIKTDIVASVSMATSAPQEVRSVLPNETRVRVPILVYHGVRDTKPNETAEVRQFNIAPKELDRQLAYLKEQGFTTISFKDLEAYFDKNTPLPDKPVILTFDDGWQTQYEQALPLLKKYTMKATFFLFPNGMGHKNFITWDEARDLVTAGMEIGSHSKSHQYMTKQDIAVLPKEVSGSKAWLEEELHTPVTAFSYPFGLYNEVITTLLRETGYTSARTLNKSTIQSRANRLEMPSYLVSNNFKDFQYIINIVETKTTQ
ncbi:MAG: polysaccharide deacetylase family protein [Candidatus Pacebacteria bacterium]|nr:polysaccharide deacetylase family protein [Candidatus Paceibacterota bacterium]